MFTKLLGTRDASVRDFHSFRVTWVTIALTGGVPLELVQKVTGHKTTDIVLKHYFQPGREAFREALNAAMPKLLTSSENQKAESKNEEVGPKEEMREIIEGMTAKTLKRDRERLLELVAAVMGKGKMLKAESMMKGGVTAWVCA